MDVFRLISWLFWQGVILVLAFTGAGLAAYSGYLIVQLFVGLFQ